METQIRSDLREFILTNYLFGDVTRAPGDDDGLVAGLAAELEWTRDQLVALGAEVVQ